MFLAKYICLAEGRLCMEMRLTGNLNKSVMKHTTSSGQWNTEYSDILNATPTYYVM